MAQGSINPNITFLGEKLWPVAWNENLLVLYEEKIEKMPIKSVKNIISKNKKSVFFLMSQGSFNPKIRFLGQKVCSVACDQTHTHESEYRGHPSGIFPIIRKKKCGCGINTLNGGREWPCQWKEWPCWGNSVPLLWVKRVALWGKWVAL